MSTFTGDYTSLLVIDEVDVFCYSTTAWTWLSGLALSGSGVAWCDVLQACDWIVSSSREIGFPLLLGETTIDADFDSELSSTWAMPFGGLS